MPKIKPPLALATDLEKRDLDACVPRTILKSEAPTVERSCAGAEVFATRHFHEGPS
jgi:hypothetical protein